LLDVLTLSLPTLLFTNSHSSSSFHLCSSTSTKEHGCPRCRHSSCRAAWHTPPRPNRYERVRFFHFFITSVRIVLRAPSPAIVSRIGRPMANKLFPFSDTAPLHEHRYLSP
jgi:hypothetical protein